MGNTGNLSSERRPAPAAGTTIAAIATILLLAATPSVAQERANRARENSAVSSFIGEVVRTNPEIDAQRNQVRVLEARLAAARGSRLPEINASGLVQRRKIDVKNGTQNDSEYTLGQGTVEGRLLLYDGEQTSNAVNVAIHELASGQANFHATVADVLLRLLTAQVDVQRDEAVRLYSEQQSDAIAEQLRAIGRRVELAEATKTDQALARSRLAVAQAAIIAASEQVAISRSAFQHVAGKPAGTIPQLPDLAPLPSTLAAAQTTAADNNPRVRAARRTAVAARYGASAAKGALLPRIDAVAGFEYLTGGVANLFTGKLPDDRSSGFGGLEVAVPLFRPRLYAEIDRSKGLQAQRLAELAATRRTATDLVTAAWAQWRAAGETIETSRISVSATEQAAKGTRREWEIGNRTIVDVLDAQNELLNARVALARAVHDEYVARASILNLVGELNPQAILRQPYQLAARQIAKARK